MLFITRIRKDPDVRRTELIDVAFELFNSNGYEKTMIVDIVKKAGLAKGTFYYYFPTKEAILEAIYILWATDLVTSFLLESRQATALDKLHDFIGRLYLPNPLFDSLWNDKHFNLVYQIWQQQIVKVLNLPLVDIIKQGNQEETMHVVCINEIIPFFWNTLDCLWQAIGHKEPSEVLVKKVKVAESILERILGINEGILNLSIAKL